MPFIACLTNTTRQQLLQRHAPTPTPNPTPHPSKTGRTRPNAYGHQCKMLASTMQISNNKPTNTSHHTHVRHRPRRPEDSTPHTGHNPASTGPIRLSGGPDPSGPNSVPTPTPTPATPGSTPPQTPKSCAGSTERQPGPRTGPSSTIPLVNTTNATWTDARRAGRVLLRKEVIQPHLPVRLPCYDFVPIASPTFDGSLPQGVRPPASGVADFRDVTGGVYKARERIHRSVADLRLLATPTSWGRVADPNPN